MIHTPYLALDRQKTFWPASDNIWSQRYATTNEPVSHLDRQILLRKAVYYSHFKKHDIPKHTVKDRQKILSFKRCEQVSHNPLPGLSAFQIIAAKPGHILCQKTEKMNPLAFPNTGQHSRLFCLKFLRSCSLCIYSTPRHLHQDWLSLTASLNCISKGMSFSLSDPSLCSWMLLRSPVHLFFCSFLSNSKLPWSFFLSPLSNTSSRLGASNSPCS